MKDNILNFQSFKNKFDGKSSKEDFNLAIAKKIISEDSELSRIIGALGISEDKGARYILDIANLHNKICEIVYDAHEKSGFDPGFALLVVQSLAQCSADELTGVGFAGVISPEMFQKIQARAVAVVLQSKHIDEMKE